MAESKARGEEAGYREAQAKGGQGQGIGHFSCAALSRIAIALFPSSHHFDIPVCCMHLARRHVDWWRAIRSLLDSRFAQADEVAAEVCSQPDHRLSLRAPAESARPTQFV